MAQPWYTTRETVKQALDVKETARSNAQIDRAIASASRMIDGSVPGAGFLHRRFYPELRTMTWDWPNAGSPTPWRLWLDADEIIEVVTLTAGGVTLAPGEYMLRPDHGPPFTHIEINRGTSASFTSDDTPQRAISGLCLFGYSNDEAPAGTLAEALDASKTGVDVTDSAGIGVGSIIRVDTERMIVTGKTMATTGQTLGGNLTALNNDVTVPVASAAGFAVDETILIDAERMLIVDIAGNNLIVKRPWDGSVLAAHTTGATIYAPRTLTVTRGALGTTAATHLTSTAIARHVVPGLVEELCVAEALNHLLQERSGYARTVGTGENQREMSGRGLREIKADAYTAYGRKARQRAV